MSAAAVPAGLPTPAAVMARARGENFPVASRVLPRPISERLLAIYGFARLADELGDTVGGDRLAALAWLEQELDRAYAGRARHPLLVRLQAVLRERPLPREPFARLLEANHVDQRVARYGTWEALLGYCHLSADPVGELVLAVFDRATPERVALSNHVCTALQLAEHWQDVAEDLRAGRIYLPASDMEAFGVTEADLALPAAPPQVRALVGFETTRARFVLDAGAPLIGMLRGAARAAVAGYVAGGRAALAAIAAADHDVLAATRHPGKRRVAAELALAYTRGR